MIFIDGHGSPGTKTTGRQQMTTNKHVTNEKYDVLTAKMKVITWCFDISGTKFIRREVLFTIISGLFYDYHALVSLIVADEVFFVVDD